jgi:hypothetical protein
MFTRKEAIVKHKSIFLLILVTLLAASLACSLVTGGDDDIELLDDVEPPTQAPAPTKAPKEEPEQPPAAEEPEEQPPTAEVEPEPTEEPEPAEVEPEPDEKPQDYDTVFPLPSDVQNFMGDGGESPVNFQTSLTLEEAIDFYRQAFTDQDLTERTINTSITDTTFSMVFDGHPNGKALVIQGVDLGENTNINIRFEDL